MATILLRNIPKFRVQLDRVVYPVEAGFCGFHNVLPGFHIVQILPRDGRPLLQAELVLTEPSSRAILRGEGDFLIYDHSDGAEELAALAQNGDLRRSLIDARAKQLVEVGLWQTLTSQLDTPLSELPRSLLGYASVAGRSRFERFWLEHAADGPAALRTVQATFIKAIFYQDSDAGGRLRELLQSHYHAGERGVALAADYFPLFADWLVAVVAWVPDLFRAGSATQDGLRYLIEDLRDIGQVSGNPALESAASRLRQSVGSADQESDAAPAGQEILS
jgi:hypothetical protein